MENYGNDIWTYIYSMARNRATADDLTQEVFLRGFLHHSAFRGDSHPKTWLLAIAKNVCADYFRSAFVRRVQIKPTEDLVPPCEHSFDAVDSQLAELEIWDAVMKLETKYREVVVLRLREDLSFAEIAKITGVNQGALRIRYQRALKMLRARLNEGVDSR